MVYGIHMANSNENDSSITTCSTIGTNCPLKTESQTIEKAHTNFASWNFSKSIRFKAILTNSYHSMTRWIVKANQIMMKFDSDNFKSPKMASHKIHFSDH